ncbi:NACHT domain-containing protein [Actinomycetospora flava]|uniref:NACHT domain-containing protein n=1 Tax=Actinomycetospora flava TaxID=3129232 RepID=UPI0035A17FD4
MPIRWSHTDRSVVDHPHLLGGGELPFSDKQVDLASLVEALKGPRPAVRVALLGDAGTGKSTLAIQILLRILDPHCRERGQPVPVLLTSTGWNTNSMPDLSEWMKVRMQQDYAALRAFGPDVIDNLIRSGLVWPIVDGLDELPEAYRPLQLQAINQSLADSTPIIITCRTADYESAVSAGGHVLRAAVVLEPSLIPRSDIADYLASAIHPPHHASWARLLKEIRAGQESVLTSICSTAIGLWLLRVVYVNPRCDPTPLLSASHPEEVEFDHSSAREALEGHLYRAAVPSLVASGERARSRQMPGARQAWTPTKSWRVDRSEKWLAFLASYLRTSGSRDFRWWELGYLELGPVAIGKFAILGAAFVSILVVPSGVPTLVATGTMLAVTAWQWSNLVSRRIASPVSLNVRLTGALKTVWDSSVTGLATGALAGLALLTLGLLISLPGSNRRFPTELMYIYPLMLIAAGGAGLVLGFGVGCLRSLAKPSALDSAQTPISTYRASRGAGLLQVAICSTVIGIFVGWLAGPLPALTAFLVIMLVVGPSVASISNPWWPYLVAATIYGAGRKLPAPWRVMTFLDDMARVGVLRRAGAAYQFRHASVQDYLAGGPPEAYDPLVSRRRHRNKRVGRRPLTLTFSAASLLSNLCLLTGGLTLFFRTDRFSLVPSSFLLSLATFVSISLLGIVAALVGLLRSHENGGRTVFASWFCVVLAPAAAVAVIFASG